MPDSFHKTDKNFQNSIQAKRNKVFWSFTPTCEQLKCKKRKLVYLNAKHIFSNIITNLLKLSCFCTPVEITLVINKAVLSNNFKCIVRKTQ